MNYKHLFWLLPLSIALGLLVGFVIGTESTTNLIRESGVCSLCEIII